MDSVRSYLAPVPAAPAHDPLAASPGDTSARTGLPRVGMPAKDDLEYLKTLIELLVLLLAVPWLIARLARSPKQASRKAAGKVGG